MITVFTIGLLITLFKRIQKMDVPPALIKVRSIYTRKK
jgi:hypothetical protein